MLTVVMADPTNQGALSDIKKATKCNIQAFVASASEIVQAIEKHFHIKIESHRKPNEGVSRVSFRSAVKPSSQKHT